MPTRRISTAILVWVPIKNLDGNANRTPAGTNLRGASTRLFFLVILFPRVNIEWTLYVDGIVEGLLFHSGVDPQFVDYCKSTDVRGHA